jgi:hypothetical protein
MVPIDGVPLLSLALKGRMWSYDLDSSDYRFVVRQVPGVEKLVHWLRQEWPGCEVITLDSLTKGAMFTALCGVATLPDDSEAIIVDLADILFDEMDANVSVLLHSPRVGAVVPCFESSDDCYSYLRSEGGRVIEAAEKRVISNAASAGVYAFRDRNTFIRASVYSIAHADKLSVNGVQFVCPMVNGVLNDGLEVIAPKVRQVRPIGKMFH